MNGIKINAVAYPEGDVWVVQGIEYDIVAHTSDASKVPGAFMRAVVETIRISEHLGRRPLEGIKPAPDRYVRMFESAASEVRSVDASPMVDGTIRLAALAA